MIDSAWWPRRTLSGDWRSDHPEPYTAPCHNCGQTFDFPEGEDWSIVSQIVSEHWHACPESIRIREARSRRSAAAAADIPVSDTGGENGASRRGTSGMAVSETRKLRSKPGISKKTRRVDTHLDEKHRPPLPRTLARIMSGSSGEDEAVSATSRGQTARRGPESERSINRSSSPHLVPQQERLARHGTNTWTSGSETSRLRGQESSPESSSHWRATMGTSVSPPINLRIGRRRKRMWAGSEEEDNESPTLTEVPAGSWPQGTRYRDQDVKQLVRDSHPYVGKGKGLPEQESDEETPHKLAVRRGRETSYSGGGQSSAKGKGKGKELENEVIEVGTESSVSAVMREEDDQGRSRRPRIKKEKGKLLNEQERKEMLEADEWAKNVQPHSVDCVACNRTFALDTRGRYRATNWYKHRGICGEISRLEREREEKGE